MLGRHEQAIEAYQRAARLLPQSVVPHLQRARALERMEKFAEAEAAYREGLKVGPNDPRLANNLAYLLANRRLRLDEALSLAKQAVARDPKRATYHDTLGVVLQLRGDEAGEEGGDLYLVFEYVPGRSLAEIIRHDGAMEPE